MNQTANKSRPISLDSDTPKETNSLKKKKSMQRLKAKYENEEKIFKKNHRNNSFCSCNLHQNFRNISLLTKDCTFLIWSCFEEISFDFD